MGFLFDTDHTAPYVNECMLCACVFDSHSDDPDVLVCPDCGVKGEDGFITSCANKTVK